MTSVPAGNGLSMRTYCISPHINVTNAVLTAILLIVIASPLTRRAMLPIILVRARVTELCWRSREVEDIKGSVLGKPEVP